MLEPLKQWVCDTCGELIKKPEEGYVQFHRKSDGTYDDFIIVHHKLSSPYKGTKKGCYKYNSDCDLTEFLGDHGTIQLLTFIDIGPYHMPEFKSRTVNYRKWVDFFYRLQLPYYEEARRYWNRASADGYFGNINEVAIYQPKYLKEMIEHYKDIK
jgi:hypothetical protein